MRLPVLRQDQPLPDTVLREAARRAGEQIFALLLAEETWVHRRVETIHMLSTQVLRRSVSVDFTIPGGARRSLRVGESTQNLVPLATLAKRPLRNFDLRDESGGSVPVLGRDHNGPLAHSVLVKVVNRPLRQVGREAPSDELIADLEQVVFGSPEEADRVIASMRRAEKEGDQERQAILADDATVFLLADLADNYLLVGLCDDVSRRRVLKFSYEEAFETAKPDVLERLGWRPLLVGLDAPGASRGASYHAEVVIPEELRLEASFLYDDETGRTFADDGNADRAALYAARVPLGARTKLLFGLKAERTSFPIIGAAIAWINAFLLLAGVLVGDLDPERADSAVAVLLAASAVFAGAIARSGEHRVVQVFFAGPRLLLVVASLSALVAGGALAYGLSSSAICTIWWVAAVVCLVVASMLTVTALIASPISPEEQR